MKRHGFFFYILIVLALAAVAGLCFLLAPGSEPDTPAVLLPAIPSPDSTADTLPSDVVGSRVIQIDTETVQTALATLDRAENYSRTLTVQNFWTDGSVTAEIRVWVHGENARITLQESGRSTAKNILIRDQEKWIWYSDDESVWHGAARDGDADAYQMLLTYEDVLALNPADILDAGYVDYDGDDCIYVHYASGSLGYVNRCYISVDTGLLMGAETYDGSVLISSVTSTLPDISTPDEEIFAVP